MNDDIDNQGPTTSIVFARLVAVRDIGRHDILDHNKPRERWDFETEPLANGVSLVAIHFPKWRHPHSARGKFVRAWLGEAFRP